MWRYDIPGAYQLIEALIVNRWWLYGCWINFRFEHWSQYCRWGIGDSASLLWILRGRLRRFPLAFQEAAAVYPCLKHTVIRPRNSYDMGGCDVGSLYRMSAHSNAIGLSSCRVC